MEAFKQLLGAVLADWEMAFVLVPHLDAKHESQMVAILSQTSLLPVVEAADGMIVESKHVYVIPAKNSLTIHNAAFQLSEPPTLQGHEIAIDVFLRSLAKDQGERSIGIVLSGTGSHGTLGIRDIKLAGGMVIAQQPTITEFDSMPSSILNERLADFVLPPAEMDQTLMHCVQLSTTSIVVPEVPTAILEQLRKHSGYDFGSYRKSMMLRRIGRRMGRHHLERLEQYVERLSGDPKETSVLYRDLLISVTSFFRDAEVDDALSKELLSGLKNRGAASFPFRVWVPGCATGEEAYSLAMLLIESLEGRDVAEVVKTFDPNEEPTKLLASSATPPIKIFASDVDEVAIAIARAGVYPSSIASDVSPARLERFFVKTDKDHFQIGKQLRDSIVFSRQNVINDPPFSKLDLISCRNLLIYFEPKLQQRVLSLFHFALTNDSLLMLGQAESLGQADDLFKPVAKKCRLFAKVPSRRHSQVPIPLVATHSLKRPLAMQTPSISQRKGYKALVDKTLVSHYGPATAQINRHYEVLYVTGPLVDYLEFPPGEPNQRRNWEA